jgi:ribonuclease HIII
MPPGPFVTQLDLNLAERLRLGLEERGFALSQPAHTIFSARKTGITCTLYTSGKLVVQGKEMQEFIEFFLEPEILERLTYTQGHLEQDQGARMGGDEAGKGDFFGPLVIAAVFADAEGIQLLWEWGVKDSKKMGDKRICELAKQIRNRFPHHVLRLNPVKYNELYEKFGNLNTLLAWAHAATLASLQEKTGCTRAIVDQFASPYVLERAVQRKSPGIFLEQRVGGESDIVVAAASILARCSFVEAIDELGTACGTPLPKGASSLVVKTARLLFSKGGPPLLRTIAKTHFKTYNEIAL